MNHRSRLHCPLLLGVLAVGILGLVMGLSACAPQVQDAQDAAEMQQFMPQFGDQQAPGEMKTLAVIAVNSYEKLMRDASFLGSLAGMTNANQILEAELRKRIQDRGLAAIDKTKPWGVVIQTDGLSFPILGCIPVTKADDLLAVAQANGIQVNSGANGVTQLQWPNGPPAFVKADGGWALLSQSPDAFDHVPANLQADLVRVAADYNIAARLSVQQVPEIYRQVFIEAMRSGMENALQRMPGESDEQFESRQQMTTAQINQMEQMFDELDELTLGIAVDSQQQRAYMDVVVKAVPGGKLARQVAAYRDSRTKFSGFYRADAAATLTFVNQLDPADVQADMASMRASMDAARQQMNKAIEEDDNLPEAMREAVKAAVGDFAEALLATVETGKMDGGAALHLDPDALTFVAGAKVKDSDKIVSGLKKLDEAVKEQMPGYPGVQWNAAEHANVAFHTLSVPLPDGADEALRRMIGDELAVAVGVEPEAVYLAVGRDNLATVQQAIDASRAEPNKSVPPFELAVSLGPIIEMAAAQANDDNAKRTLQVVATMLKNDTGGRDHVRIVGQIVPDGLRYRFEAEEGALRAIGQAVILSRMQAMGM